jgi:hypothetical protein
VAVAGGQACQQALASQAAEIVSNLANVVEGGKMVLDD